jgi:hypothetical protein
LIDAIQNPSNFYEKGIPPELSTPIIVAAPYIFIRIGQALEYAQLARQIPVWKTHPSAEVRKGWLLNLQKSHGLSSFLEVFIEEHWKLVSQLFERQPEEFVPSFWYDEKQRIGTPGKEGDSPALFPTAYEMYYNGEILEE